ncbi:MAG: hypothetical protein Q4D20_10495 [Clostridia bacterium]|nr:hypothetical protein [Clostridia bacterium]
MTPQKKTIDIDGSEAVSKVLLDFLNTFPGVAESKKILFATLSEASGIGFFPTAGAVLQSNTEDVTGHVKQVCLYPFNIVYRAALKSESQRMRAKEWLDTLGKWLEKQEVTLGKEKHKIKNYPALKAGNRTIKSINRTSPAYFNAAYQDGVEDWLLSCTVTYENEFDKY